MIHRPLIIECLVSLLTLTSCSYLQPPKQESNEVFIETIKAYKNSLEDYKIQKSKERLNDFKYKK